MKVLISLILLSLVSLHFSPSYGQTPKKNDRSAEWEYKQFHSPPDEILNQHAKEGWEIADAVGGGGGNNSFYIVILKRHKSHDLFGTRTEASKPEQPPQNSICKLTLAQAPVMRGLRLGMTSDEIFTIFPPNEREEIDRTQQLNKAELPPNYGYTNFQFIPSRSASKDRFMGIGAINIGFLDRKVVNIHTGYSNTPQFESMRQLIEVISRQFSLPDFKDWQSYSNTASYGLIDCDGFRIQVLWNYGSFSIELTDQTYKKIVEDRRQADLAKKRAEFKF